MGMDQLLVNGPDAHPAQRMAPSVDIPQAQAAQLGPQVAAFMLDKDGRRLAPSDLNLKMMAFMRETEEVHRKGDNIQPGTVEALQNARNVQARSMFIQLVRQRATNEFSMGRPR